jgi:formylglycine-generating enzyme required for sulfatase activity
MDMPLMLVGFIALFSGLGYANDEITVDLPNGTGMEMVWIEPGSFAMGSPGSEAGSQHQVTISKGFYLGKYEITQEQWEAVIDTRPWAGHDYVQEGPNNPAVDISWDDVQVFIHQLNQAAGDSLYRLPMEAEWEYACRAGSTTRWSFGDDENELWDYAWYSDNTWNLGLEHAQPVGTKLPNLWGLFDMHGNVWEWCQDWYGRYSSESQTDPPGPLAGSLRVLRGGAFSASAQSTRSAVRGANSPGYLGVSLGARLSRMGPKLTAVTPHSWGQIKANSR